MAPLAYFVEPFDDDGWTSRWTKSTGTKTVNDQEVLAFDGAHDNPSASSRAPRPLTVGG